MKRAENVILLRVPLAPLAGRETSGEGLCRQNAEVKEFQLGLPALRIDDPVLLRREDAEGPPIEVALPASPGEGKVRNGLDFPTVLPRSSRIVLLVSLVAAESFLTLAWTRVLLRLSPRRVLRNVLQDRPETSIPPEIPRIFSAVAARVPFSHNCLHRSLALQRVLARRGFHARLQIGIGRKPALFPGHAWLEAGGVIINDEPSLVARYVPLNISEAALEASYR